MTRPSFLSTLLTLLPAVAHATYGKTTGFIYNDDAICAYPFDDFTINSVTCDSFTNKHILVEGVNDYLSQADGSEDECHYGDRMELQGEVTTVEAVSRYFDIYVHVCFKSASSTSGKSSSSSSSSSSGSSGEKCFDYQTSLNLGYHKEDEEEDAANDNNGGRKLSYYDNTDYDSHDYRNENYYDFLPEGTYAWTANLKIPSQSFSYRTSK